MMIKLLKLLKSERSKKTKHYEPVVERKLKIIDLKEEVEDHDKIIKAFIED